VVVATLGAADPEESFPDEHAAMAAVRAAAATVSRRRRFNPATTTDTLPEVH